MHDNTIAKTAFHCVCDQPTFCDYMWYHRVLELFTNIRLPICPTEDAPVPQVTADHPSVQKAVEEAVNVAMTSSLKISPEMYMEAFKNGIEHAELKRREADSNGPQ